MYAIGANYLSFLQVKPTFSVDELQRRLNLLRTFMITSRIDAVLFTSYHNINYYCDFLYCAFGRTYGLVVTMDKVLSISAGTSHPVK